MPRVIAASPFVGRSPSRRVPQQGACPRRVVTRHTPRNDPPIFWRASAASRDTTSSGSRAAAVRAGTASRASDRSGRAPWPLRSDELVLVPETGDERRHRAPRPAAHAGEGLRGLAPDPHLGIAQAGREDVQLRRRVPPPGARAPSRPRSAPSGPSPRAAGPGSRRPPALPGRSCRAPPPRATALRDSGRQGAVRAATAGAGLPRRGCPAPPAARQRVPDSEAPRLPISSCTTRGDPAARRGPRGLGRPGDGRGSGGRRWGMVSGEAGGQTEAAAAAAVGAATRRNGCVDAGRQGRRSDRRRGRGREAPMVGAGGS